MPDKGMIIEKNDVIWSYFSYIIKLINNFFLLLIMAHFCDSIEIGLWYTFLSLSNLVNTFDIGFAAAITRNITYVYCGANEICSEGVNNRANGYCNKKLLGQVYSAGKKINMVISSLITLSMLSLGSIYIFLILNWDITKKQLLSWLLFILALFFNFYFNYAINTLKGLGKIAEANKGIIVSQVVQGICTVLGFICGYGILAMVLGYLLCGISLRIVAIVYLKKEYELYEILQSCNSNKEEIYHLIKTMWPVAKKQSIGSLCAYLAAQISTLLCSSFLGLSITASYGLIKQMVTTLVEISKINFNASTPLFSKNRAIDNKDKLRIGYSKSVVIYTVIYLTGYFAILCFGLPLLEIVKSDINIPFKLFNFVFIGMFIDGYCQMSCLFMTTGNCLPHFKANIFTTFAIVTISIVGVMYLDFNIYMLVGVHFTVQLMYNYWHWPLYVLRELKCSAFNLFRIGIREVVDNIHFSSKK